MRRAPTESYRASFLGCLALASVLLLSARTHAAPTDARAAYELKCLYCHSDDVAAAPRLKAAQWRELIGRMRRKAPLLISRRDVGLLTRYLIQVRKRVPVSERKGQGSGQAAGGLDEARPGGSLDARQESRDGPSDTSSASSAAETEVAAAAEAEAAVAAVAEEPELPAGAPEAVAEAEGPRVLETKCSKCHTLYRVYLKIDSLERGVNTVERMRRKTGSGITPRDADMLIQYLRAQL